MKILYIAGTGRNGSTLLSNMLGSLPGFVHVGELMYLWDRGVLQNWECGCGKPFKECSFWQKIVQKAGISGSVAQQMLFLREQGLRSRHLFLPERKREKLLRIMGDYLNRLETVYLTIHESTHCEWLVDSSKFPSHAYLLSRIRDFDVYVLHLVRDPRAVAFSWWQRPKNLGYRRASNTMPRINPIRTGMVWLEWNYLLQRLWGHSPKYLFLRYEDFVTQPRSILSDVLKWLGLPPELSKPLFIDERTVRIFSQHTVSGNPVRFSKGEITISDAAFALNPFWKIVVSILTAPLLIRYRYPVWR